MTKKHLTFYEVSLANKERANRWHQGFPNNRDGWTGADWANATQGEAGELAEAVEALIYCNSINKHLGLVSNLVKKLRRIDTGIQQAEQGAERDEAYEAMLKQKLATEIGDTFIYLDLLTQFLGLETARCVADTFNRVSVRENFPERLDY
jgi:NTP pyrophosphatase (non-canonical NTP hydrolase)